MVVRDLQRVIDPTAEVTIWTVDSEHKLDCPYIGRCMYIPDKFDEAEVFIVEAVCDDLELTVRI